jgi:HEAT repeat protein
VAPLVEARGHPDWKVRAAVAGALGRISEPDAIPGLVELLNDTNEIVRTSAAVGLARIAEADDRGSAAVAAQGLDALLAALADPYYSVRESAERALVVVGKPAVDPLIELATGASEPTRLVAIRTLGEIGDRDAVRTLRNLLRSESWTVAAYAAEALGGIGLSGGDRRTLERMLEDGAHPFIADKIRAALEAQ